MPKTILIPIPISKSSAPRFRNSVEGLNQEIERITIQDSTEKDDAIVVSPRACWLEISRPGPACFCDLIRACVFGSHRMSQMGTVHPRPWLHNAAAAPAASTLRLPQGAA